MQPTAGKVEDAGGRGKTCRVVKADKVVEARKIDENGKEELTSSMEEA